MHSAGACRFSFVFFFSAVQHHKLFLFSGSSTPRQIAKTPCASKYSLAPTLRSAPHHMLSYVARRFCQLSSTARQSTSRHASASGRHRRSIFVMEDAPIWQDETSSVRSKIELTRNMIIILAIHFLPLGQTAFFAEATCSTLTASPNF